MSKSIYTAVYIALTLHFARILCEKLGCGGKKPEPSNQFLCVPRIMPPIGKPGTYFAMRYVANEPIKPKDAPCTLMPIVGISAETITYWSNLINSAKIPAKGGRERRVS